MSPSPVSKAPRSIKSAGRALEKFALPFRSFVHPWHIWTYWDLSRRHAFRRSSAAQFVCFDFASVKIDNISGRYLFSLVRDFESLGFPVCYRKNFRFIATMRHKRFKKLLLERPFQIYESLDQFPQDCTVVEVTDRLEAPAPAHGRQIRVRYEERWPEAAHEVPMTFSVYPPVHDHWAAHPAPDLAGDRPLRVFFSGRVSDPKYGGTLIRDKFGKMSRQQMVQTLERQLVADRFRRITTDGDLRGTNGHPGFVLADGYKIPQTEWLDVLGRADFFLACPGMEMPLCHNLVEALSRGAVPIIEHPEFLDPRLEHNLNCLVFRGPDELVNTVERAFQLGPDQIRRLREGAYEYYQNHLAPGRFAKRLLSLPHSPVDLLLNSYRIPRTA
jgi:hypothetical protein